MKYHLKGIIAIIKEWLNRDCFIDARVSALILQNTLIMVNQGKSSAGDMILFTTVRLLTTGWKGSKEE